MSVSLRASIFAFMGIRIGAGLGPISVSAGIGGGGGGGGGGDGFWIFVCVFGLAASGVPMAFEIVRDFVTDKAFWIVFMLGVIPSIALLLLHARLLSTKRGGRLEFNSYATMFLALPAAGYEIITMLAIDNQSGQASLYFLSLVPYGFLHWRWIRWTTRMFSAVPRATDTARWEATRERLETKQGAATSSLRAKHDTALSAKQIKTKELKVKLEESLSRLADVTDKALHQAPDAASASGIHDDEYLELLKACFADVRDCLYACQGFLSSSAITNHQSGLVRLKQELEGKLGFKDL